MILIWKGKGILILLYFIVCFVGSAIIAGVLSRNLGGIFQEINFTFTLGIAFLLTSIWTYLTSEDYYKDADGNKQKLFMDHELFFIPMKVWSYIFLVLSILAFCSMSFNYIDSKM
jgi:ribose/xylose/arabinose/galactoside ABC-type transport system permease subunit